MRSGSFNSNQKTTQPNQTKNAIPSGIFRRLWFFPFLAIFQIAVKISPALIPSEGAISKVLRILLLNISVGLAGFVLFWIASLSLEYMDYVLLKHLLTDSKENQKHVQAYSLKYLDSYFEALYNLTKSVVPYACLLHNRNIVPMLPKKTFWEMFGQAMENLQSLHFFNSLCS
jgi:hypothetical protein